MNNTFIDIAFLLFTIALLCRVIAYGLYEIRIENNPFGGACIIVFSIVSVIFSNVMVWVN